jgi:predicted DNA-binding ribbon-helix-helix protein
VAYHGQKFHNWKFATKIGFQFSASRLDFAKNYKRRKAMCKIFSELGREQYTYQTRSVRLGGHATSVRLEAAFWSVLQEIAASEGVTLGRFLTKLHDEVLEFRGEAHNFSSLLRCACLAYVDEIKKTPKITSFLAAQHREDFVDETGKGTSGRCPPPQLHAEP